MQVCGILRNTDGIYRSEIERYEALRDELQRPAKRVWKQNPKGI